MGAKLSPIRLVRMLLPAAATALALLPLPALLAPYPLLVLCHMLVLAIACLALNLLLGTSGMLSLGHAAYYGAAAYAGAFLCYITGIEFFEVYLAFGVLFSAVLAAAVGFLCLRVTKIHFVILTLAISMLLYSAIISGGAFRLFGDIGAAIYEEGEGSMYLPRMKLAGTAPSAEAFIPAFYYVIAGAFVAAAVLIRLIQESAFGQALRAIRDNETRAAFIGIHVRLYRWVAFILSGLFMGLAGGLYGQLDRQITTDQLHWLFSAELVLATVLGGTRYFLGPVLGAIAFVGLDELTSRMTVGRSFVFGLLLILVIRVFPQGIAGGWAAAVSMLGSRRRP